MKTSGPLWCGGGPTRHSSAMAGTAAMVAAAPSIVRRVIFRQPEAMLCCIVSSSNFDRASGRLDRFLVVGYAFPLGIESAKKPFFLLRRVSDADTRSII